MKDHLELLISFEAGEKSAQSLIDWAILCMQDGIAGDNLNGLAWLKNPSKEEAFKVFLCTLEEQGLSIPPFRERKFQAARKIAKMIVDGSKDPNEGCTELAVISRELKSPDEISIFELLDHEQIGHEHINITSENIRPSIFDEAQNLIKT